MSIRTVEIVCLPCQKCEAVRRAIMEAVKNLEIQNKIQIVYDFKHSTNLKDLAKYSVNAAQTPVVIINGQVEFAGLIETGMVRKKLEGIHKRG
ncbi:MAG: thioredoxin family protein [Deltaproteobacteria bacterium]